MYLLPVSELPDRAYWQRLHHDEPPDRATSASSHHPHRRRVLILFAWALIVAARVEEEVGVKGIDLSGGMPL